MKFTVGAIFSLLLVFVVVLSGCSTAAVTTTLPAVTTTATTTATATTTVTTTQTSTVAATPTVSPSKTPSQNPLDLALVGIGGKAAIDSLKSFSYEAAGVRGLILEGMAPESSPVERTQFSVKTNYDIAGNNLRLDYVNSIDFLGVQTKATFAEIIKGNLGFISGVQLLRGGPDTTVMLSERMASARQQARLLNPQVILKEALADPSKVKDGGTEMLNGKSSNVLIITDDVYPIKLFLDPTKGTISRLSTKENDLLRRDTKLEVFYDDWQAASGSSLMFPAKVMLCLDDQTLLTQNVKNFTVNPTVDSALFNFPATGTPVFDAAAARFGKTTSQYFQMFAAVGLPREGAQTTVTPTELAPGVFFLAGGSHNSMVIEQEKGIVVVEAPLDELRSNAIIAWIKTKFPNKPIVAAVSTHHHVDHTGGLRTFAAEGATIVVDQYVKSFWEMALKANSTILPDALSLKNIAVKIETVPLTGKLTLADALRPVTIYHVPSTHAEDVSVIVADKEGILFVSDLFSPGPGAAAGVGAVEVDSVIQANKIPVKIIAGGHGATNTYAEFKAAISAFSSR